jgi:hypothetical protein
MAQQVLIISAYLGSSPEYLNKVIQNHKLYAEKHNYNYDFISKRELTRFSRNDFTHYSWAKVELAKEKLKSNAFVFWIDADSIFVDFDRDLSDLIDAKKDLVFTGDSYDVFNTGHFLIRNSKWSHKFLDEWLEMRNAKFPKINSSHQDKQGYLVDQPAANILLRRGMQCNTPLNSSQFNWMNGYPGNKERKIKFFHLLVSPIRKPNLFFTQLLVHKSIRKNIRITLQDRLNGYPFRLPGYKGSTRIKIMHFPGNTKNQISVHLSEVI